MNIKEYISSGIIESYVLGLATPEEASILECIQKNNEEVRLLIAETQKSLEELATRQAEAPAANLKSAIWDAIQKSESAQDTSSSFTTNSKPIQLSDTVTAQAVSEQKNNSSLFMKIAASLLLVASIGYNFVQMNDRAASKSVQLAMEEENAVLLRDKNALEEKWNMMNDPDMTMIALKGVEKHPEMKAHVFWKKDTKETYLSLENLPKPPENMQYQLWAIVDGKPVDIGTYALNSTHVEKMKKVENAQAFAITLEKEGGNATPTMENMYVMGGV